jgi:hypothetical protein
VASPVSRFSQSISARLLTRTTYSEHGLTKWWGAWLVLWNSNGFLSASHTMRRWGWLGVRRWFFLGGDESRTAQHEAFWIALGATTAGLGGVLRFIDKGTPDHVVGWVFLGIAIWICLAFFFPLWLPRVRDATLIRQRREADREREAAITRSLSRAIDAVSARDERKRENGQKVQALLDHGSALRTTETNYRPVGDRGLLGTPEGWRNVNAWRDESQAGVESNFASEAFRISELPRLTATSSSTEIIHVIDEALRPLHNWRNELAKP